MDDDQKDILSIGPIVAVALLLIFGSPFSRGQALPPEPMSEQAAHKAVDHMILRCRAEDAFVRFKNRLSALSSNPKTIEPITQRECLDRESRALSKLRSYTSTDGEIVSACHDKSEQAALAMVDMFQTMTQGALEQSDFAALADYRNVSFVKVLNCVENRKIALDNLTAIADPTEK